MRHRSQHSDRARGVTYMVATALCWSIGGLLIKLIPWNAFAIMGVRSAIAFVMTLIFIKDRKIRLTKSNVLGALCLLTLCVTYIVATKLTTAANAIVLQYTAPIIILLISIVFLKQRATRLDVVAMGVIFLGILLFFVDGLSGGQILGNGIALISGFCLAGVFLCNAMEGATPEQATLLAHGLGTVLFLPYALTQVTAQAVPWVAVIIMGVVQLGLAYLLLARGSRLVPPLVGSLITCIEPILNPVWVALAVGEIPGPWALVGMGLVIFGVVIYNVLLAHKARSNPA